jgi:hypothetical protein
MLATLNGLIGGVHFGFGKGIGALMGGTIIAYTGSTAKAYRVFGVVSAVCAILYFTYLMAKMCCKKRAVATEAEKGVTKEMKTFVQQPPNAKS